MKSVKNVLTLISSGRPANFAGVLCPSKLKYDGQSVPRNPLDGRKEMLMALTAKQKKLPKALQRAILAKQKGMGKKKKKNGKKKKGGKKRRSRG